MTASQPAASPLSFAAPPPSTGLSARFAARLGSFSLDCAFHLPGRGVSALFGPSGCGKTTVLRCLAGLTRLDEGELHVNGACWQAGRQFMPPHQRPVGYVFQEASLFPHLSVRDNLRYGLRRARRRSAAGSQPENGAAIPFDDVVGLLGIERLFTRAVPQLSGGERQRVAIGRALLSQPRLLLMDEPLSALDRASKDDILPYLERLHDALSIPVVYVSHDLSEVERLADTLVLMEGGRVLAQGPLPAVLADPALPLTHQPHAATVLMGTITGYDAAYDLTLLAVAGGTVHVPGALGATGARRRLRILASDVSLGRQPPLDTSILNALPARVLSGEPTGGHGVTVILALGEPATETRLLARISRKSWDALALRPGEAVHARLKAIALAPGRTDPL
ncbi:molybdenum ABC transporter ATP-binding protein [Pararhodospirillum oryzae]|uniref:Uncharacterized protein n=1 Tax=Pararhodospirillum oryzae TaxID=478448 RepID=A0A512H3X5_9PROT|nr:molybdenum ABC transporter ATP-binding protein [Pararhodospirillum oryzae]GEO80174.1 hypothetical protein ROR02_03050 [Pararhodospirillum oryzae]